MMGTPNLLFVKPKPPVLQVKEVEIKKCSTCNVTFFDSSSQKSHFKSEWHLYNIKRKNSQLPTITEDEFLLLKNQIHEMVSAKNIKNTTRNGSSNTISSDLKSDSGSSSLRNSEIALKSKVFDQNKCLFNDVVSKSINDNVSYMEKHYTFFLPEKEYISDLEGLLRYLHNKIYHENKCLYCHKSFLDHYATLHHMVDKQHHKINDDHFHEISSFYDFIDSYVSLIVDSKKSSSSDTSSLKTQDGHDDDWEDIISSTNSPTSVESLLSSYGFKKAHIMENGNLSLPNGKEAVHRELSYVYKQNLVVHNPFALKNKQNNFKFKNKSEKKQIIMSQKQAEYRMGKRDLNIALKSYKLFVPVRQDICFV
uniref:C2H2 type zinc-finger (2 copies), putative n=1 Tax=Theileria annulata TaxID=5874 RepID=A0A3B0NAY6_THEAN